MPAELWLNFTNENGITKRVLVTGESFVIGRTPDNDLPISLGSLSRQHAKIERFGDVYTVFDCGSSNGSTLNGERLESPRELKNGDEINLGNEVEIRIEITSGKSESPKPLIAAADADDDKEVSARSSSTSISGNKNTILIGCLILVPVLGVIALLVGAGILLITNNSDKPEIVENRDIRGNKDDGEDMPTPAKDVTPEKSETPVSTQPTTTPGGGTTTPEPTETIGITPKPPSGDTEKAERASASFLRRIAQNEPNAFLTTDQIALILPKINQLKNSGAVAENIRNAKKNASEIEKLAATKDLKAQFLANAAITKLGEQKGDVVGTAREMLESLSNISKPFGNESSDETLLVIAAYSNSTSGESLQNIAGSLTQKNNDSPRKVRTIWYFKKNGKLTEPQFEFALKFLAIGAISQNPKDFGMQSEPLVFN